MIKFTSRWSDKGFRESLRNMLYQIVLCYGGYVYYQNHSDKKEEYQTFFKDNSEKMYRIFINSANSDAKKYFLSKGYNGISGTKMRKLIMSKRGVMAVSYDWINKYVEYIIGRCMGIKELNSMVKTIITKECNICTNHEEHEEWMALCLNRLLGFQYDLLIDVEERGTQKSIIAERILREMRASNYLNQIVNDCHI